MKKISVLSISLIIGLTQNVFSQGIYNNGNYLIVPSGSEVRTSNYTNGNSGSLTLGGNIYISGNWTNNKGSVLTLSSGTVTLNGDGSSNQQISGSDLTEFYNFTIASGAKVEIPVLKVLKVTNTLTNSNATYNNLVLKSNSSGTAYLINSTSGVKGTQELFITYDKYHLYSSSINNAAFPFSNASDYANTNSWSESTQQWVRQLSNLTNAKGYAIYANSSDKTLSTTGEFNAGTINFAVAHTDLNSNTMLDDEEGWNLTGNPYPCPVSITSFTGANNTLISGTIYIFDHYNSSSYGSGYNSQDYIATNGSGSVTTRAHSGGVTVTDIAPGQGFFVRSLNGTSGNISFTHSQKNTNSSTFYTPDPFPPKRLYLGLWDEKNNYNKLLIAMKEDATMGIDNMYDGYKLQGNPNLSFYSLISGEKQGFVIQTIPVFTESVCIPLGLYAGNGGKYLFELDTMENFEPGQKIYFEDRELKKVIDISTEKKYETHLPAGRIDNRFFVYFNSYSSISDEDKSSVSIFSSGKNVFINNFEAEEGQVVITDLIGKQIYKGSINQKVVRLDVATGYYLVNIHTSSKIITEKIFIQ